MEGAGICIIANKNGVPALSLKIVSDNADETSPADFNEIRRPRDKRLRENNRRRYRRDCARKIKRQKAEKSRKKQR